jgi:membrane-bound metal-dependent hydrolase YbcI (DUF457 family)
VTAGASLLPDIDHPGSTVARTLGPATRLLARTVSWVADWVRDRTCGCCATPTTGGHRTLTHTAVGAATMGAVVSGTGLLFGRWVAAVVVFCVAALAVRALPRRWRRKGSAVGVGLVAGLAVLGLPADASWWWVGLAVALGCLVHSLGDALTLSAVPLWWPLRIRGCRWHRCGMPRALRFRTGSRVELWLVVPTLLAVGGGSVWVLGLIKR